MISNGHPPTPGDRVDLATFRYDPARGWSGALPDHDSARTLVLAFGAPDMAERPGPLAELADAFPRSAVLACSTAGEFLGAELRDGGIVGAAVRFAASEVRIARAEVPRAEESRSAGLLIAEQLADPTLRGALVLSDGLHVNGSELVRGLEHGLGAGVVIGGGLAADGTRFARTWLLDGRRPRSGLIRAVGLYGDGLRLGSGSVGGWDIFGPVRMVTRSDRNVLFELDGRPALELYEEYLGDYAAELPAAGLRFPLEIREVAPGSPRRVRTILGVDRARHALVFAGDVPEGSLAQLMRANVERLIDGAEEAAAHAAPGGDDGPTLAVGVSCVGRRLVLGDRAEEEIEVALDVMPPRTGLIGFYSNGEISRGSTGSCELHNQTMTVTTIAEDAP